MKYFTLIFCFALSTFTGPSAHATIPASVSYQAYLTDSEGSPVTGTTLITISMYNVEVGGSPLWDEAITIDVDQGLVSLQLGNPLNPLPLDLFDNPVWLGTEIESDGEMTPRRAMTSVGFSFESRNTQTLQGQGAMAYDQSAHVGAGDNPHAVSAAQIGAASAGDIVALQAQLDAALLTIGALQASINENSTSVSTLATELAAETAARISMIEAEQAERLAADGIQDVSIGVIQANSVLALDGILTAHTPTVVRITGRNLQIVSGSGSTDDGGAPLGLGNLLVGYDSARGDGSNKTGSHNLVVGDRHNYSSVGGVLGGFENTTSGPWSTAVAGQNNTADGVAASVLGGRYITARADWATGVGGGGGGPAVGNTAHARFTTVVGGQLNQAGNPANPDQGRGATGIGGTENNALANFAVTIGGFQNTAAGEASAVIGGRLNRSEGGLSVVGGGVQNVATGADSMVSGGGQNVSSGTGASVTGGYQNLASGSYSSVSGGGGFIVGQGNRAASNYSSVSGGRGNVAGDPLAPATAEAASISGGESNVATGAVASVAGGFGNRSVGSSTTVSGGVSNVAGVEGVPNGSFGASVTGGETNRAEAASSSITGGRNNRATGSHSSVTGGGGPDAEHGNLAYAEFSTITGGRENRTGDLATPSVGTASSINGGSNNIADGLTAIVSGGGSNRASGENASVSGGLENTASGWAASISGGAGNLAIGEQSSVSGGGINKATGNFSSVTGGGQNDAIGALSSIVGGQNNVVTGTGSFSIGSELTVSDLEVQTLTITGPLP